MPSNMRSATGKNARSHSRNVERKKQRRAEAESRNAIFQALPVEEKRKRNPRKVY